MMPSGATKVRQTSGRPSAHEVQVRKSVTDPILQQVGALITQYMPNASEQDRNAILSNVNTSTLWGGFNPATNGVNSRFNPALILAQASGVAVKNGLVDPSLKFSTNENFETIKQGFADQSLNLEKWQRDRNNTSESYFGDLSVLSPLLALTPLAPLVGFDNFNQGLEQNDPLKAIGGAALTYGGLTGTAPTLSDVKDKVSGLLGSETLGEVPYTGGVDAVNGLDLASDLTSQGLKSGLESVGTNSWLTAPTYTPTDFSKLPTDKYSSSGINGSSGTQGLKTIEDPLLGNVAPPSLESMGGGTGITNVSIDGLGKLTNGGLLVPEAGGAVSILPGAEVGGIPTDLKFDPVNLAKNGALNADGTVDPAKANGTDWLEKAKDAKKLFDTLNSLTGKKPQQATGLLGGNGGLLGSPGPTALQDAQYFQNRRFNRGLLG